MTRLFHPGRIVGGSVIAEAFFHDDEGHRNVMRGVEVTEEPVRAERLGGALGPYRTPSPAPPASTRWVEVVEAHELWDDEGFLEVFQQTAAQLAALAGGPMPAMLHAFGRDGLVHAVILERPEGARLDRIVAGLHARGERVPIPVALAIARRLAPLWLRADETALYLELGDVRLSPQGHVRARPELPSERARQVVGAAVAVIPAPIAYLAPEAIMDRAVPQSGMYTLGLLLYELLVGERPLAREGSAWALIQRIVREERPPIETQHPELPQPLAAWVNRAVAKEPGDRFGSWKELVRGLSAVASSFDPTGPTELAAWLRSLPEELRRMDDPPPDVAALGDWRRLPHTGWVPVAVPERAPASERPRAPTFVDARLVYAGRDQRPMLPCGELLVDARPVTAAEYERFAIVTGTASDEDPGEEPRTQVTFEQAEAYARWAGKRLPTEEEWTRLVAALGAATLGVGEVWEWTATPKRGGHVVCGGRWRDAWERAPDAKNRSHETAMAADVGFRCVMDR